MEGLMLIVRQAMFSVAFSVMAVALAQPR
jgi:hypothetical protein